MAGIRSLMETIAAVRKDQTATNHGGGPVDGNLRGYPDQRRCPTAAHSLARDSDSQTILMEPVKEVARIASFKLYCRKLTTDGPAGREQILALYHRSES